MSRMPSAAMYKGWKPRSAPQNVPRPGTRIRKAYDLLVNNPGTPVALNETNKDSNSRGKILEQLQDIYGLDVRMWRQGSKLRGPSLYILAGRWSFEGYQDFLPADKLRNCRRGGIRSTPRRTFC